METLLQKPPMQFTADAIKEIKNILNQQENNDKPYLRIGVKGGGCSGMSYVLGFDALEDGDTMYEIEGVKAVMKQAHSIYLIGIEIDYKNGLDNRGFTFNNPNASSTCGCGQSFAV
jgi:iron-sulfur cluster assembly protein